MPDELAELEHVTVTDLPGDGGYRQVRRPTRWISDYAVVLVFVGVIVGFSIALPQTFFTVGNLQTIVGSQAVLLILTLGLIIPLSVGEFDLSIGALLGFSSMMLTWLTAYHHWNLWVAVIACLGIGLTVGGINGFLVVKVGLNAFIATLGTQTLLGGLTLGVSGGQILSGVPQQLTNIVSASLFGFPSPVYFALGLALVLWYVFERTPTGRYMYFVGTGSEAARLAGLRVDRLRWCAFAMSGLISSIAGLIAAGQLGGAVTGVGDSYLLPAYAAAFLGATTIHPGRFNPWGTVIALYLLVTGVTGLELLGAQDWVGQVFNGIALLAAVAFARLTSGEARAKRRWAST